MAGLAQASQTADRRTRDRRLRPGDSGHVCRRSSRSPDADRQRRLHPLRTGCPRSSRDLAASPSLESLATCPVPLWDRHAGRTLGSAVRTKPGVHDRAAGRVWLDQPRPARRRHDPPSCRLARLPHPDPARAFRRCVDATPGHFAVSPTTPGANWPARRWAPRWSGRRLLAGSAVAMALSRTSRRPAQHLVRSLHPGLRASANPSWNVSPQAPGHSPGRRR